MKLLFLSAFSFIFCLKITYAGGYHLSKESIIKSDKEGYPLLAIGKMTNIRELGFYHEGKIVATSRAEFNKKYPKVDTTTVLCSGTVLISKMLSNDENTKAVTLIWNEPKFVTDGGSLSTCPSVTYSAQSGIERIWFLSNNEMHLKASADVDISNLADYKEILKKHRKK